LSLITETYLEGLDAYTREALAGVGGDTSETGAEGRNESRNEKIPSQSRIEIGGKLFSD
jgi:hypothetical protein